MAEEMKEETEASTSSEVKPRFLDQYDDVNGFVQQALRTVLQATKCSNEMPATGDDYDFYSSFPKFQDAMNIEGRRLLHMMQSILKHQNVKVNLDSSGGGASDIDDKLDLLMDANDQILERVGQWMDEASGVKKQDDTLIVAPALPKPKQFTTASWNKKSPSVTSPTSGFRLLSARNIQRPQLKFKDKIDNSRLPFRPRLNHKYHAKMQLEESLQLPSGVTPDTTEDPMFIYPHPYQYELDNLEYLPEHLTLVEPQQPKSLDEIPCIYIETEARLKEMVEHLKQQKHIAVDLEHHDYRSFQGFTCLMQISSRTRDFLIDTLALRTELHILNEIFADPTVVKVLHGAQHDIGWLMRDLGLYVVNMFDTGQAASMLNFNRLSLAYLLQHYCNVTADKKYQLADWRIRPLPEELMKYAREDTHYLLYIYDKMKNELIERGNENNNLLMSVLQKSTEICCKLYRKPVFTETSYKNILRQRRMLNSQQTQALQNLYAWRDQTARMEDESTGFVLPNHMLMQICEILPKERQGILACCNPIPPLVRQYLPEMHNMIKKAREMPINKPVSTQKIRKPTHYQHPKYDVDSLLNCPHDLSHIHQDMAGDDTTSTLLDASLVAQSSHVFPELSDRDNVVVKEHPLISVFGYTNLTCGITSGQKKASEIEAQFSSPYLQFMPELDTATPSKKRKPNYSHGGIEIWKLKRPVSKKENKEKEQQKAEDKSLATGPPAKRSRTDLHTEVNRHVRFDDDGDVIENYEKTEDDKKALPQDVEIPLKFNMPEKKKKKNNRNRDVDILDAVQKHLSNIRKIQEENEMALGQNPGDDQPLEPKPQLKKTNNKSRNKDKRNSDGASSSARDAVVIADSDEEESSKVTLKVNMNERTGSKSNKNEKVSGKRKAMDDEPSAVVIDSSDDEKDTETKKSFKPYDYSLGAKKLLEADKTQNKKDYFNPMGQMKKHKGPKGPKNKGQMKRGSKSFTFRR